MANIARRFDPEDNDEAGMTTEQSMDDVVDEVDDYAEAQTGDEDILMVQEAIR